MNKENRNIEDFLRGKMSQLENSFQDDWSVFEEKLERALFLKRLRFGIAFSVLLIATSIGILSTSNGLGFRTSDTSYFGRQSESGFEVSGSQSQWSIVSLNQSAENTRVEEVANQWPEKQDKAVEPEIEKSKSNPVAAVGAVEIIETPSVVEDYSINQSNVSTLIEDVVPNLVEETSGGTLTNTAATENYLVKINPKGALINGEFLLVEGVLDNNTSNQEYISDSKRASLQFNNLSDVFAQQVELKPYIAPTPIVKARPSAYVSPLQEKSLWEFSIKAYPNFTFRKFKVDEDKLNLLHRDFIDQVEIAESGGFTFNIGLEVSRRVADATYINSGIEYISYKTDANFDFTNFRTANIDPNNNTISSYTLNADPEQIVLSDVNTYHYINIPLSIAYRPWASKHVRLNIETGISYMRFLTAKGNSLDYRTLEVIDLADRDFRKSMGSVSFRVGATYYISSQFNLGFEPTFVYFTNTIYTEEYPFEIIPYSVGLNLKLQVKLN